MQTLIVAEKPSVASRIAAALGEGAPQRKNLQGVSYFEMYKEGNKIVVVAAAGHLFTLAQKGAGHAIPTFDVEWVPSFKTDKNAYFTKKYLDTIKIVGSNSDTYINACDYDVEGTVIGTNIIRYVKTGDVNKEAAFDNVKRMHFSTTTLQDLLESYAKAGAFDKGNFEAGETRHILDWLWGINMSRALMRAIHTSGNKRVMSIGRVQGPALAILAKREKEIKVFTPRDYWELHAVINAMQFKNVRGPIFDGKEAERISAEVAGARAMINAVEVNEMKLFPFPPFDLTSLQLEANRVLRMDPSKTLAVAQSLYERSYISYPRTASQKLPYSLNMPRILGSLAKNPAYKAHADALIKESRFRPVEGKKEDEAHPAIYPTGEMPTKLSDEEAKLYDLITRRFLSLFAEHAVLEKTRVQVSAAGERYEAAGSRLVSGGWLSYYTYYQPQEASVGKFTQGLQHAVEKSEAKKLVTKPPERYSKASLIALLEHKDLGTKATRAAIIDTLFKRGYLKNGRIEVTDYGMSVYDALNQYIPEILDEAMTHKLETDMEEITRGKATEQAVVGEGREMITRLLADFKGKEKEIGTSLGKGLEKMQAANILGKCPKDGGDLVILRSRIGKQFVGCANWPKCNQTYPLPQGAKIVPTGKVCELCRTPIVKVFRNRKVFQMDLDPSCETKKDWAKKPAPVAKQAAVMPAGRLQAAAAQQPKAAEQPTPMAESKTVKPKTMAKQRKKATKK